MARIKVADFIGGTEWSPWAGGLLGSTSANTPYIGSANRTINYIVRDAFRHRNATSAPTSRTRMGLQPFPDVSNFADLSANAGVSGKIRGMVVFEDESDNYAEKLGVIVGNTFVVVNSAGTVSTPGTVSSAINTDFGTCDMVNYQSGSNSIVCWANHRDDSRGVGVYTPSTDTQSLSAAIGTDFALGAPLTLDTINRQLVGSDGEFFATSAPGSTQIDTTDRSAEAEAFPDRIRRPVVIHPYVYFFGTKSIEVWQNTGSGKPPFSRLPTGVIEVGCAGPHAVGKHGKRAWFISNDGQPYELQGTSIKELPLSDGLAGKFRQLATLHTSDLSVMPLHFGHELYVIFNYHTFTSGATSDGGVFVWNDAAQVWTEVLEETGGSFSLGYPMYLHQLSFGNKNIIASDTDLWTVTSGGGLDQVNGEQGTGVRIIGPINSEFISGETGRWVYMTKLIMLAGGFSTAETVTMYYTDNYGRNWTAGETREMSSGANDREIEVSWTSLGRFKERIFKFEVTGTSTVPALYELYADVRLGGHTTGSGVD